MNQNFCRKLIVLLAVFTSAHVYAQKIILVTSQSELYSLELVNGSCVTAKLPMPCTVSPGPIFSIALFKDTLYFNISGSGQLYRSVLNQPGSCTVLKGGVGANCLTVDKYGMLYYMNGATLTRYNPHTDQTTNLGPVPFGSAGDLVFYKDKLYLAAPNGLVEIDMDDPSKSKLVLSASGYSFFGMINVPDGCDKTRVYGLDFASSSLVELDIDNAMVLNKYCSFPLSVYDAASITESGIVPGITVLGVEAKKICSPGGQGSIQVRAYSAVPDVTLTYTLDGAQTNADGKFSGVAAGNHTISIKGSDGCTAEVSVTVEVAEKIAVTTTSTPDNCGLQNGVLRIQQISSGLLMYSLNNNTEQTGPVFSGLPAGNYLLRVKDENECRLDTTITIERLSPPIPISSITVKPSSCQLNDGQIDVVFSSPDVLEAKLDNGPFRSQSSFTGLAGGSHQLQLRTATCVFDTTVIVPLLSGQQPAISYTNTGPNCFTASNGSTTIHVSGPAAPFTISFDGGAYTSATTFTGLAAGVYRLNIKDANGCAWPAADTIPAYTYVPPFIQTSVVHSECITSQPGKASLVISGPEAPYTFEIGRQRYNSGIQATLSPGTYNAKVFTASNCLVDSVNVTILLQNSSGGTCDTVYVPSAFTPNGDGRNDILAPIVPGIGNQKILFSVYNRWGQLVYQSRTFGKGWDGRIKGQPQPTGAFVWVVEYTNASGETRVYKGTTLLLR